MLIAGNWKMHGGPESSALLQALIDNVSDAGPDVLVCPPATLIASLAAQAAGSRVAVGAQDCHAQPAGAHTGDVSAEMLAAVGATHVLVGHSERRADHGESDEQVADKARAAWRAGLVAVICVGESEESRDQGVAEAVVSDQIERSVPEGATPSDTVVAYEPVWAIGTGRTASPSDVAEMHGTIRDRLDDRFGASGRRIRLLYGGSVKPSNAASILALPDVDGALVGGASLRAEDFLPIVNAAAR